jgi:hypothetical protein
MCHDVEFEPNEAEAVVMIRAAAAGDIDEAVLASWIETNSSYAWLNGHPTSATPRKLRHMTGCLWQPKSAGQVLNCREAARDIPDLRTFKVSGIQTRK